MAWFVKIEEGIVDKATFDQYVPAHTDFVKDLVKKGHQARTGYWAQRGGGMLLFQADSMEQAKSIIEKDPLIINHCVNYKLYEWKVVVE
ncbi:MAG: YciI family protein [Synechococcales bacterium]|nr:YciI family protein [Synechococcales bacterium]